MCVSMMISSYLYIVKVINFLNELEENEKSFSLKDEGLKYFISQRYIHRVINYGIKLRTKTRAEKEYESQRLC